MMDTKFTILIWEQDICLVNLLKIVIQKKQLDLSGKGPHPKTQIITLKAVKELHPFMEEIEYKIGTQMNFKTI